MARTLRFAVFGAGFWTRCQLAAWREVGGVQCVGIYNRTRARAEALADEFGIPSVYDDPAALLDRERPDFVDNITEIGGHAPLSVLCARRRIPCICQKPMAASLAEARRMVAAFERTHTPFFIHENWRWQAPLRQLRALLAKKTIGTPLRARLSMVSGYDVFANQPALRALDHFILMDLGTHILDVARALFGEARSLSCMTSRTLQPKVRGENLATLLLTMGEAATHVAIELGYALTPLEAGRRELFPQTLGLVEGSKGSIELAPDYTLRVTTRRGTVVSRHAPPAYPWVDPAYAVVQASIVPCCADLLGALRGRRGAGETTGADNLKTMTLVFAAYDSARTGLAVHWTPKTRCVIDVMMTYCVTNLRQRGTRVTRRAAMLGLTLAVVTAPWMIVGCGGGSGSPSGPRADSAAGAGAGSGTGSAGSRRGSSGALTIGVAFETLQTEFWVAALDALKKRAAEQHITLLEAVADGDASKQFDQVRTFVTRRVDGIIIVPKDGKTVIPMIRAANAAKIPVVLLNRPADPTDAVYTVVAPDNVTITKDTVTYLIEQARAGAKAPGTAGAATVKAAILVGDLSDVNAVGRRDGFEQAVTAAGGAGAIDVVARIPTDWNQERALAGLQSALQAHPDIALIFSSSDFMFPSIKSVLSAAHRWKKAGEPGHVVVGGFDGDATAYRLMVDGYVDATGVQDVFFEVHAALQAIADAKAGKTPPARIPDPGFVMTQANRAALEGRMWGATVAASSR